MTVNVLLDPDAHPVVGHRGAAGHAPENTLESFRLALTLGAEALELDVQLTLDGVVVVSHDPAVDRVTDGRGPIASYTLASLQALDAGAHWTADGGRTHPWRGRGVRLATLDALLEECGAVPLIIDAKTERVAEPLARVLRRHAAEGRVLVGSFHRRNLRPFSGAEWSRIATRGQSVALLVRALLRGPAFSPAYAALAIPPSVGGVSLPMSRLTRAARRGSRPLHVWTVNDAEEARRLWRAGVNGLVGDDPAMLRRVRAELGMGA